MARDFVGSGYATPTQYRVHVEQDGALSTLTHNVRGSKADYVWDSGGPGSSDLARALLWTATGVDPEWRIYRLFKTEVVSTWPRRSGECWRISEDQIRQWLAGVEADIVQSESPRQTEARLVQERHRESRLRLFGTTFRK